MKRLLLFLLLSFALIGCSEENEPTIQSDIKLKEINQLLHEDDSIRFSIVDLTTAEDTTRIGVTIDNKTDGTLQQYVNTLTINDTDYDLIDIYVDTGDDIDAQSTLEQGFTINESVDNIEYINFNYKYFNHSRSIDEWIDISYEN